MEGHYEKAKIAAINDLVVVAKMILNENDSMSGDRRAKLPAEWQAPLVRAMNELNKFQIA